MHATVDGSELLTGPRAGELLSAAVAGAGGMLRSWTLDHVDHRPGRSTKALYRTSVSWPQLDGAGARPRQEMFGASAHVGEAETPPASDDASLIMSDGGISVRIWRYPHDPWLPALAQVCYPDAAARTLALHGIPVATPAGRPLPLEVLSYRPGRRAVLRADLPSGPLFLKVVRPHEAEEILARHVPLARSGVPVPPVLATSPDGLLILESLRGRPLASEVLEKGPAAVDPRELVALLDAFPAELMALPRQVPWSDSIDFYCGVVGAASPELAPRLARLSREVRDGLAALERSIGQGAIEPVHGDFYEAQIFVENGHVVGVLDIDTVGPGRRADDLACLLAHLSVLADYGRSGKITAASASAVGAAVQTWLPALRARVDPRELSLRTAGVVISLATGPHRQQEDDWRSATEAMVALAERWLDTCAP